MAGLIYQVVWSRLLTLVIGVGIFAITTVIVDFLIFMRYADKTFLTIEIICKLSSFFPAGLSLVIELMFTKAGRPQWDVKQIIKSLPTEEVQNPVVYR